MVHAIDLTFYNRFCKDIKNLSQLQDTDRRLKDIKDKTTKKAAPRSEMKAETICRILWEGKYERGGGRVAFWFTTKSNLVSTASVGHLGMDNCVKCIGESLHMKILGKKFHQFIPSNVLNHILSKKNTISQQSRSTHVLLNYTVS